MTTNPENPTTPKTLGDHIEEQFEKRRLESADSECETDLPNDVGGAPTAQNVWQKRAAERAARRAAAEKAGRE